jgi:hypothetical protein
MVELVGVEPTTSSMPRKRAPTAPQPHVFAQSRSELVSQDLSNYIELGYRCQDVEIDHWLQFTTRRAPAPMPRALSCPLKQELLTIFQPDGRRLSSKLQYGFGVSPEALEVIKLPRLIIEDVNYHITTI